MKKGVIFDLDGTLWDSSRQVVDSWNERLTKIPGNSYCMSYEQMQGYMGKTMDEIAFSFFYDVSREKARELLKICTDYENKYIAKHGGVLFPDLEETLKELKEQGYFTAIVSNCQKGYIEAFLEFYGFADYIDDTENYENTMRCKGENIALVVQRNHLDRAVYVGDTMGDYEATREAGIPFIHAAYGFGQVPEGTRAISRISELPDTLLYSDL